MNHDDEVFAQALELSGEARLAFLDRVGREDPALRQRIEALLAGLEAADGFMEKPAVDRPAPAPEEKPGDRLGRYTLGRKLGEGGCGVVYLAEQTEPVRRQVALKVIKLGMDTVDVIARFEAERQALALMDHPDIARVFDAGATAAGRPFFVMEFVDGVPITRYCDEQKLPMAQRLELFARVCVALQHAHQKGIIHRDIKPSNILVSTRDGEPAPKVIDFGIAKATQGRLTEHTLLTALHQFIGTPAYMSPEQAELREGDVDTRSDVYSLGVLLYELLTGRPPYDPRTLQQAGIDEIRRIIREIDPPRPSAAVSTLTVADRTAIAAHRQAVPTRLTSVLAGDLDWIVMRCLEKQRGRRYDSASELAEDVRRHLRNQPVVARPPSLAYQTRKFIARNQLACASATVVLVSIIAGAIIATTQAIRAKRAEQVAVAQRDAAREARAAEAVAREDAQRRQDQAEELLTFMLGDFRNGLKAIGRLDLLDAVGRQAMAYFEDLDPRDLTDTALTRQAKALTQLGDVRMDQANYADAQASFAAAHERAAALADRHPENPDILFERAQAEFWLGYVARARGETAEQRRWLERYRDSAMALRNLEGPGARAQAEVIYSLHNLAVLDLERGDIAVAVSGFTAERTELEAMLEEDPRDGELWLGLAEVNSWLGSAAEFSGDYATALAQYDRTSAIYEEVTGLMPQERRWPVRTGDALGFKARLLMHLGRYAEAASTYERARQLVEDGVADDPDNRRWRISRDRLALGQVALAQLQQHFAAASANLAATRERIEILQAEEPTAQRYRRDLAFAWLLTAREHAARGADSAETLETITRAVALADDMLVASPGERAVIGESAAIYVTAARVARARSDEAAGRQHARRALDLLTPQLEGTRDWRLLEPAAAAFALLGDEPSASRLREQLRARSFVGSDSLDPSLAMRSVTEP